MYHFTNTSNPIDFPKMSKKLFLIYYECAHWCGAGNHVVVWAKDEEDAREQAEVHMEEDMRELYSGEYEDEDDIYDSESAVNVITCEEFGPEHEDWKFYIDPSQAMFYPVIGEA